VTTLIGDHGLSCLDDFDPAAIPLSLQANAEAIDSTLAAIDSTLDGYNNRGWAVATTTSSYTISQTASDFVDGDGLPGAPGILGSSAFTVQVFGLDTLPFFNSPVLPAGWYMAGAFASFQATGAVTANSRRNLGIEWFSTLTGVDQHDYAINMVYESNTAGDSMTVQGLFHADGTTSYNVDAFFWHNNAGSTMQVNSGAKVWVAYAGTGLVI
jgi:hypothetical protein